MKQLAKMFCAACLTSLLALPVLAQRPGSNSSSRTKGRSSTGASTATGSVSTRGTASAPRVRSDSRAGSSYRSFERSYSQSPIGGFTHANISAIPELKYSSFYSAGAYYRWQDYLYRLRTQYFVNGDYFERFYRNREPLLTPRLQKLSVWNPLMLSKRILAEVDELEQMLLDVEAGKPVNRENIRAKTDEIRDLSKKIRSDDLLSYLDQRKNRDITKGQNYDQLGLNAIGELRVMASDLNSQLSSMYNQETTSTISLSSLTKPSFESLSKGIDKLCKIIDKSAKKL